MQCSGGHYEGRRGSGVAFDRNGKEIRSFKGDSGNGSHQQNFIDAVRKRDLNILNADIVVGNDSTAWCNLANSAFRASREYDPNLVTHGLPSMNEQAERLGKILSPHGLVLQSKGIQASTVLEVNSETGKFVGVDAEQANQYYKRSYRPAYAVPQLT